MQVGVPYSSVLVATGGNLPYTFLVLPANPNYNPPLTNLPAGLTLNSSTGALTGTPTTAGTYFVEFEVYDAQNQRYAYCPITVTNPVPLSVTCQAVNTGDVGVAFNSGPMTVTGGTMPYTFSIVGTLPAGLTLNTTNGAVTGTPTTAGTFTVKVTDAAGNSSTSCMITINGPLSVTCAATNAGDVGVAFDSGPMTVTGGTAPYTYSIVGGLPPGLTLNPSNGEVTGTPTGSGTFTVKVTDAVGNSSTSCMITINGPLSVTCSAINTGEVGVAFNSGPMMVTGGTTPYMFSIVGTLPAGLMLNASTGAVMGTPSEPGIFTVRVTDALGNSSTSCMITINGPLSVTCSAVNTGEVGVQFDSGPMTVTGGTAPYTYSIVGGLPPGLTLNPSNGEVTGTPTASGTFTVEVTDALGNSSTSCMITINGPLSVTCSAVNTGDVGVQFDSGPMTVTGGTAPYTYSIVGGLPPGLTLNPSNGEVTGTPTASGTFTVEVTDALGNSSTSCMITINGSLSVTCAAVNTGTVGVFFDSGAMTVTGGTAPYTFSIGSGPLPAGLTLNPSTGEVTGTPTAPGAFTVQVTDSLGGVGTACMIAINPPLSVTCAANNTGTVGVPFNSGSMTVTGGAMPYTFSIGSGMLPAGLTLNTSTGAVTGTPTASGTFTVQVTDALGNVGTACAITINSAVSASCVSINAVQGVAITPVTMTGSGGAGGPYTFTATGLPPGLSISSNGTISGTPTHSGTFPYTVTVTDSAGNKGTVNCSVTVAPPVSASCVSINAVQGVAITPVTMTGSGGAGGPYTFTATGLPAGLSISTGGTISGTPTQSGTFPYTVTVTDKAGNKGTVNCSVTVAQAQGSVEGTVWNDANANGVQDSGESGFKGVTVKLESNGTVIATQVTNSQGGYNFTGLTPGSYTACVDPTTLPVGYIETYDSDGLLTPNCATGSVPSGQEITLNFGYFKPACESTTQVTSNFNSTPISAGKYLWYTVHLKASGLPRHSLATVRFDNVLVEANINGVPYNLTLSSGIVVFNPNVTTSTLTYDAPSDTFTVTVPTSLSGNAFVTGFPYLVPSGGLPGGISNVKVTGRMSTDVAGVSTQWQWAAAVYTKFNSDVTQLGIKPVDDNSTSQYHNSDPAGTPENYKQYVTGGGCGNGGSNYIGNNSPTGSTQCQSGCQHKTYTCNEWNSTPHNANPGGILGKNYSTCYPNGQVVIGGVSTRGYTLTFTNATAVQNFVLQGGTPGVLSHSDTNPTGSAAGSFAGDVLALRLNIDYSAAGITGAGLANRTVVQGPLWGYTVQEVMDLANAVLGGQTWQLPRGMSVSGLDAIVGNINSNYENGAIDNGYLQ